LLERHFVRVAMERTNADPAAAAGLLGVNQKRMALLQGSTISRPGNSSPEGS
jgi:hypothetical protein